MKPIYQSSISITQADAVLRLDESHFLDFKSKEIKPSKLSCAISAFANADGGELYVGVTDDRKWLGFNTQEDANQIIECINSQFAGDSRWTADFLASPKKNGPSTSHPGRKESKDYTIERWARIREKGRTKSAS